MSSVFTNEVLTKLWVKSEEEDTAKEENLKDWVDDKKLMEEITLSVMARFKDSDMVATDILQLADLRSLFIKLVKEMNDSHGWSKEDTIGAAAVLACLSAFGNKKKAVGRMKRSTEFTEIMTKMGVSSGKYNRTSPTSFPLRYYARLFPMAAHETAAAHVAPRFWLLVSPPLSALELKYAMENLITFCYPGSAAVLPKRLEGSALDMWIALNTAISIVIGRRKDGSGVWKTASVMETVRFLGIAQQERSWVSPLKVGVFAGSFSADVYLRNFCKNPMYSDHPLYGAKAPVLEE